MIQKTFTVVILTCKLIQILLLLCVPGDWRMDSLIDGTVDMVGILTQSNDSDISSMILIKHSLL